MSTRALYTFKDESGEYHVYKHHDGYPEGEHGAIYTIAKALKLAWDLPRFEADEFAASFVATHKEMPGGVRLMIGGRDNFPDDIQYHYIITAKNGMLHVQCREPGNANNKYTGKLIKQGTLDQMKEWANPSKKTAKAAKPVIVAVNQAGDHNTGSMPSGITVAQINKVLGFKPNIDDDESKVKYSWGFTVDGKRAGIWDYKGHRWSIYDPDGVVPGLFANLPVSAKK